jgi:cobalt-zinc-cadmium efflux system outer membrane protein
MKKLAFLLLLITSNLALFSQVKIDITLEEFLLRVKNRNLNYAAELLNIDIADARIEAAKVFNDPSLGVGFSNADLGNKQMGGGLYLEVSKTLSPGKRVASANVAKTEKELSIALLDDYFHSLRAEATHMWLEIIRLNRIYSVEKETYIKIKELVTTDSLRLKEGKINETDALQSFIEAGSMYHELLDREAELNNAIYQLSKYCSVSGIDTVYNPASKILRHGKVPELKVLIASAKNNRADLIAAENMVELSKKVIELKKISRRPDLEFNAGISFNRRAHNIEAPSPSHNEIYAGLSIPIPFSKGLLKGELKEAKANEKQNILKYQNALLQIETEVVEAYNLYIAKDKQLKAFSDGLLLQAKNVLAEKKKGYSTGEVQFLEVLDAQRTYDSILIKYYNTFYDKTAALINLQRAAAYWDLR